jgi:A/G-specific adenine glycosylase
VNLPAPFMSNPREITDAVQAWFAREARDLPWRVNRSGYRVWVSEIMLQQTQVVKVVDYFNRFMARFESIEDLANAPRDEVLSYWTGLGYYSRCLNLHKGAQKIVEQHGGKFPQNAEDIAALPGVGSYTAGAIRSFAFNQVAAVVDGNIARVLSRLYADSSEFQSPTGKRHFEALSLAFAQTSSDPAAFHEGIMEIGATVCKPRSPVCTSCPLSAFCAAYAQGKTEDFPTKSKKIARTELHAVFAVIGDDEHLWLERNEQSRLLGNLYAPPHVIVDGADAAPAALEVLSRNLNFSTQVAKPISIVRQLTHRIFHLHGYVIKASPADLPHGKWLRRDELSKVGLSSAVKALLEKAQLLSIFIFMLSGCATTHQEIIRKEVRNKVALPLDIAVEEAQEPKVADQNLREKLVQAALDAVGQKRVKVKGAQFRQDCSGTVRGIFAQAGLSLRKAQSSASQSDSKTLMDYAEKVGRITKEDPVPGDLVFFHDTYDSKRNRKAEDNISHVGIVTCVLGEDEIYYVHYSGGRILESDMRDMLRRRRRGVSSKTGVELFSGYGKFDLNDLAD